MTTLNSALADAERQRIAEALRAHRGRVGRAAQSLGISRVTLWAKMKRLNLAPQAFLPPSHLKASPQLDPRIHESTSRPSDRCRDEDSEHR
jgi:hypothetical protein